MASTIHWTRTDFEAGVSYAGEQIAFVTNDCESNNFSNYIEWGDGGNEPLPSNARGHTDGANGYVVDAGVYMLPATGHEFAAVRSYPAIITATSQCVGSGYVARTPFPATIIVYPRIPVHQITPATVALKAGEKALVTIVLTSPAPKSNTRVYLQWTGNGLAFIAAQQKFIDVPAGLNVVDIEVAAADKKTPSPKTVTLTATTIGVGATVQISLS